MGRQFQATSSPTLITFQGVINPMPRFVCIDTCPTDTKISFDGEAPRNCAGGDIFEFPNHGPRYCNVTGSIGAGNPVTLFAGEDKRIQGSSTVNVINSGSFDISDRAARLLGHVTVDSIPEVEIKNDSGNPIPVSGTVAISNDPVGVKGKNGTTIATDANPFPTSDIGLPDTLGQAAMAASTSVAFASDQNWPSQIATGTAPTGVAGEEVVPATLLYGLTSIGIWIQNLIGTQTYQVQASMNGSIWQPLICFQFDASGDRTPVGSFALTGATTTFVEATTNMRYARVVTI